ncbi:Uncharacterized conserved protein YjiS, DUF1127 family [Methylobacterium sp. ap11]|uniref:DUF1127 domain-containing protein n=1 Tax=Methylobacterium sp. ap11 TaxID=1761799 RepID=UPI0008D5AA56|nr:hypothetical protein [Methylobacterium sp. ap11]SEO72931.1 Uncharacterized conserved protein YjiS, DUF1127 family [Methylobacterium sp. ap11]
MPAFSLPFPDSVSGPRPPRPTLLGLWWRRARDRQVLAALTPAQMRDTGLDPDTVRQESLKPFWRA